MNEREQLVIKAIQFMKNHLDDDITTEDLARFVGYSPYHFIRIFKDVTGISPRHFLSALRIEAGKELLADGKTSILNTLLSVGYRSIGTFSTKFKQFVGLPPTQYKNRLKDLHRFVHTYEFKENRKKFVVPSSSVTCRLLIPPQFKGIVFVGLFPRPIPDQRPIVGTAIKPGERVCTFYDVPEGTYYGLAAGLTWSI